MQSQCLFVCKEVNGSESKKGIFYYNSTWCFNYYVTKTTKKGNNYTISVSSLWNKKLIILCLHNSEILLSKPLVNAILFYNI